MRPFLLNDPIARLEHELVDSLVRERFGTLVPPSISRQSLLALRPFVDASPWCFWSHERVGATLEVLEKDVARTYSAVETRRVAIARGLDNLFRPSPIASQDAGLDHGKPNELMRMATEALPEYLRVTEHVFGNLVQLTWAVAKRGSVEGRFDLRSATDHLRQRAAASLADGYSDRIRNAIAHGQVEFSFPGIKFGETPHAEQLTSSEFLRMLDLLARTCNESAIALKLFWLRCAADRPADLLAPVGLVTRMAAGAVGRRGLRLVGAVESNLPRTGRQLHVAVEMADRYRPLVLANAARVAAHLLQAGAHGYERLLIGADHGLPVHSLLIVIPDRLRALLSADVGIDRLPEAFEETQLLWFNESALRARVRNYRYIAASAFDQLRHEVRRNWRNAGLAPAADRYEVRSIENLSTQGIARLRVVGVLRNSEHAEDTELLRHILVALVRAGRRRFVRSRGRFLDKGIPWARRPRQVFVDLYIEDGPIRWLRSGGWAAGNLAAIAERSWGRERVHVTNPETVVKKVAMRFSIDKVAAAMAAMDVLSLIADLNKGDGGSNQRS